MTDWNKLVDELQTAIDNKRWLKVIALLSNLTMAATRELAEDIQRAVKA